MEHMPVLLNECIEALDLKPGGTYVDATLGRGGHAGAVLELLDGGRLIGIDRDSRAIEESCERLSRFGGSFCAVKGRFSELREILRALGIEKIDGLLMDLGVSSPQLDDAARGFSYMQDARLDMRMDADEPGSAYELINGASFDELKRILYEYGEERYAPVIARRIIARRPLESTFQLVEAIKSAMPPSALREKQHPAKRSFQAFRIAVNEELSELEKGIEAAAALIAPEGRLAVITFHSLEDRIVKNSFQRLCTGCVCPKDFPVCVCKKTPRFRPITKRPVLPSERETQENPRSRSAKLRVCEKI